MRIQLQRRISVGDRVTVYRGVHSDGTPWTIAEATVIRRRDDVLTVAWVNDSKRESVDQFMRQQCRLITKGE